MVEDSAFRASEDQNKQLVRQYSSEELKKEAKQKKPLLDLKGEEHKFAERQSSST